MKLSRLLLKQSMSSLHDTARHFVITGCRSRVCGASWIAIESGLELKVRGVVRSTNIISEIGQSCCAICKLIDMKTVAIGGTGSIARREKPGSNQFCGAISRNSTRD